MAYYWMFLVFAFAMANLPWVSDKCLFVFRCDKKIIWLRLLEWLLLLFVVRGVAYLLEERLFGTVQAQDWEFYAVTVPLFMLFAAPSFIYRYIR